MERHPWYTGEVPVIIIEKTPSEAWEQEQVVKALSVAGVIFFAVPNGGKRSKIETIRLKRQG